MGVFDTLNTIKGFLQGAATKTFETISSFLLKIQIFGLNVIEILLFFLFLAVLVMLMVAPAKLLSWSKQFERPLKRAWDWLRD